MGLSVDGSVWLCHAHPSAGPGGVYRKLKSDALLVLGVMHSWYLV